jgi:RNA recognition motif-containing protein
MGEDNPITETDNNSRKNKDTVKDTDGAVPNNNNNNNEGVAVVVAVDRNPLDASWYYYQNPTTGTVSQTPLSVRQLCKLLVPVREGLPPILPAHTRCLAVKVVVQPPQEEEKEEEEKEEEEKEEKEEEEQQEQKQKEDSKKDDTFGEWKLGSELEVLQEASCAQWFLSSSGAAPEGPVSCRTLLEKNQSCLSNLLVYAKDITPEWTSIATLPNLQLVLEALVKAPNNNTTTTTATSTSTTVDPEAPTTTNESPETAQKEVQDELEAFLSSTANDMDNKNDNDDDDHASYKSDEGTRYVMDPLTGNWIHEALAAQVEDNKAKSNNKQPTSTKIKTTATGGGTTNNSSKKKQHKKAKFSKRNAKHWVYVTGLPPTASVEDVQKYFSKAGLLDLDPETLQPKVKLYTTAPNNGGQAKGDASICYARPESVHLALQILDESPWDETHTIRVERATFEAKPDAETAGSTNTNTNTNNNITNNTNNNNRRKRKPVSEAKRKVARLALLQAQDEGFGERLAGGRKGLRIVVVKHMMEGIPENRLEDEIQAYICQEIDGRAVEKITCISSSNVVIIKFVEPSAASQAVDAWHGTVNARTNQKMEAIYWDGVTDYTHKEDDDLEQEEKRHDDFGKWLETQQELPPELQLKEAED